MSSGYGSANIPERSRQNGFVQCRNVWDAAPRARKPREKKMKSETEIEVCLPVDIQAAFSGHSDQCVEYETRPWQGGKLFEWIDTGNRGKCMQFDELHLLSLCLNRLNSFAFDWNGSVISEEVWQSEYSLSIATTTNTTRNHPIDWLIEHIFLVKINQSTNQATGKLWQWWLSGDTLLM
jgi:hypothetical protein